MNALSVFWSDLKAMVSKPKSLLQFFGILAIPVIYSGIFLYAFWDPYGHTDNLPVAVVNEDKGAVLADQSINIGNDLVKHLKKNKGFDWQFVTQSQAEKGLNNNKYYMVITVPDSFSKDATSLEKSKTKTIPLTYQVNRDANFIASKIGESGAKSVKENVANQITETYAKTMYDKLDSLTKGMGQAAKGANDLNSGSQSELNGLISLKQHFGKLTASTATLKDGSIQLTEGAGQLESGLKQLNKGTQSLYDSTRAKTDDIQKLSDGANALSNNLDALNTNVEQLNSADQKLVTGAETMRSQLNQNINQLNSELKNYQALDQQLSKLKPLLDQLLQSTNQLQSTSDQINNLANKSSQATQDLNDGVNQYLKQHPEAANDKNFQKIMTSRNDIQSLQKQLQSLIKNYGTPEQLTSSVKTLSQGIDQLSAAKNKAVNQIHALQKADNQLVNGMEDFQKQLNKLPAATAGLSKGAAQLANGTTQLNQNWSSLVSGLQQLSQGENKLIKGSDDLHSNMAKFSSGIGSLSNGSSQLGDGIDQLENGQMKLTDGSRNLSDNLGDAHKQLSSTPTDDRHAKMFAQPVHLTDATNAKVNNYGSGFTPYFLSLGLFVGALMLTVIYDMRETRIRPLSGLSLGLGKFTMMGLMGIAQAVLADLVVVFGLGLDVSNLGIFMLFSILASLTFMALIQFLTATLGNPGRFIAIILLILQLTTSGGTYPIQLIPKSLHVFQHLLPMTYSIDGFKNIIAGNQSGMLALNSIMLAVFLVIMLAATSLFYYLHYKKHPEELDQDERKTA